MKQGYESLMSLAGMTKPLADVLFKKGFFSVEDLSRVNASELVEVSGIGEAEAQQFIELAAKAIAEKNLLEEAEDDEENAEADVENDNQETIE
jgi:transcription termination factor NusA